MSSHRKAGANGAGPDRPPDKKRPLGRGSAEGPRGDGKRHRSPDISTRQATSGQGRDAPTFRSFGPDPTEFRMPVSEFCRRSEKTEAWLRAAGIPVEERDGRLVVGQAAFVDWSNEAWERAEADAAHAREDAP